MQCNLSIAERQEVLNLLAKGNKIDAVWFVQQRSNGKLIDALMWINEFDPWQGENPDLTHQDVKRPNKLLSILVKPFKFFWECLELS